MAEMAVFWSRIARSNRCRIWWPVDTLPDYVVLVRVNRPIASA